MDRRRMVGVDAPAGQASGCAIGGRLVLTSAHAVAGPAGGGAAAVGVRVRVFRPGEAGTFGAVVVWCGHAGGRDDAALLRVDDGPGWAEPRPVRWGRLVTDRTGVDCQAWGLPEHAQREGWATQVEQSSGWLNPGSGYVADRYVMTVRESAPTWDRPVPAWGGTSGGPVFCGPLLTGVVTAERAHSGNGQLVLSPAYALHHDPAFGAALAAHGLLVADLEAVELHELADQEAHPERYGAPARSPAALLHATRRIVPFHGRDALLGQLRNWCEPAGFEACLVHGPAGQGKTRLAQEFARGLAARGWAVLWPQPSLDADDLLALREVTRPLLVVLDYAESRTEQLVGLVRAAADHSGSRPFKVLLLARARGDWWERDLRSRIGEHLDGAPEWALGGLEDDLPTDRSELYRAVVERFAAVLPALPGCDGPDWAVLAAAQSGPGGLGEKRYSNPLTLHMTALADLLDAARPGARRGGAQQVEDRLLDHERSYWLRAAQARGLTATLSPDTLEAALAAAHLSGAATLEQARELWLRVPVVADQPMDMRERVTRWLADLYPAAPPHPFGALQPDRLAERQVARVLLADPGLAGGLVAGANRTQRAQLVTVYVRAAADPLLAGGLDGHLTELCVRYHDRLARSVVDAATRSARPAPLVAALRAVIEERGRSLAELRALHTLFPPVSVVLADTAVGLVQRIVEGCRAVAVADPDGGAPVLARALQDLAEAFGEVGRLGDAVAAAREAVELRRRLAERDPEKQLPRLALALGTLSKMLLVAGRNEESLPVLREAVAVSRGLTGLDGRYLLDAAGPGLAVAVRAPDTELSQATRESVERFRLLAAADAWAYLPNLVLMLALQAASMAAAGLTGDAVTVAREAVERLRAQPDSDREIVLVRVLALGVLSGCLGGAGRPDEAAEAAREAVAGLRKGEELDPAAEPGLGPAFAGLSRIMGEAGRHQEAVALAREWVGRLRPLAEDDPDTHLKSLAQELNNLAVQLGELGEWEAALEAAGESVRHHRRLVGLGGGVHRQTLALSLVVLSKALGDLGRWEESLAATGEAAELFRVAAEHQVGAAVALTNGARALHGQGRYREALAAAEQASAGFRALPPGGGRDQLLAEALGLRALSLCALGEWDAAVAVGRESLAVGGRAPGARRRPTAAVFALAGALSESGEDEEALSVIAGAVEEHRAPGAPPGGLGAALTLYAKGLCGAGRTDEAVLVGEEALARCRALADRNPAAHLVGLCLALNIQSAGLGAGGDWVRSVELAREAVALCRQRLAVQPELVEPQLALALGALATGLGELGESEEALAAGAESVAYYRSVAARLPKAFGSGLAAALTNLAIDLEGAGRPEEAVALRQEAVELHRAAAELSATSRLALAGALESLAAALDRLGRREESVLRRAETVSLLREPGGPDPELQLAHLISALRALAEGRWAAGQWEEALTDLREALDTGEALAEADPGRHAELYGRVASVRAAMFATSGRWAEAVTAGTELVERLRRLGQDRAQLAEFTDALTLRAGSLLILGRWEEALADAEEAVGLLRGDPERPTGLALALSSVSGALVTAGRAEEALAAGTEAVELFRAHGPADGQRVKMAGALGSVSTALMALGRFAEAAAASGEAVALLRPAAADDPRMYRPLLERVLAAHVIHLGALGRWEEALVVSREIREWARSIPEDAPFADRSLAAGVVATLGRALAEADRWVEAAEHWAAAFRQFEALARVRPEPYRPAMAEAAGLLAGGLLALARPADAAAVNEEALAWTRAADGPEPARSGAAAGGGWGAVAMALARQDRFAEAVEAWRESVGHHRWAAGQDPDRWLPTLVDALHGLAGALLGADRPADALTAVQECAVLGRAFFEAGPGGTAPAAWLAAVLETQEWALHLLDRPVEAAVVAEELVGCRRVLAAADPGARPALAEGLVRLAVWREADGRDAEAEAALREALDHYRVLAEDDPQTFGEDYEEMMELVAELDAED